MCPIITKRIKLSGFTLVLSLIMIFTGCKGADVTIQPPAESDAQQPGDVIAPQSSDTTAQQPGGAVKPVAALGSGIFKTSYEYTHEDTDSSWDSGSSTTIIFENNNAQISGAGATFSGEKLTITKAGTFVLSGTLANGQVLIDAGNDDVVRLVLNGVTLHNEAGPAIYSPESEKIVLILADGKKNTVSDGSGYTIFDDENEPYAAIFAQNDLSITGSGTLTVNGNCKHGIRTQDILVITGGEINVTSVGDALRGRDGVAIQDGSITLNTDGDGIMSNNADDEARGYIIINGGTHIIHAANDGIQAESALTITEGSIQIITGGGSENAPIREETRGGWGGDRSNSSFETIEVDSVSMKGLKAGKQLSIAGGDISIDTQDDGIHSDDVLFIMGGRLSIKTGDDGIHADVSAEISGGDIDIPVCYEGIESLSVTISGGNISIIAVDDGINASDGTGRSGAFGGEMQGGPGAGWPDMQQGGGMNEARFAAVEGAVIRISGGTIDILASRDAIDSNGHLYLEGGTITLNGLSMGADGAIEMDGDFIVTGGQLITAGSVYSASEGSTQPILLISYATQQSSESIITIKDSEENVLLEYTSKTGFSASGFTSPSFKTGETYTLFIDGEKRIDVLLSDINTSIGDDGGNYSLGRGGTGGNRGNPGDREMPDGGGWRPDGGRGVPGGDGWMPGGRMPSEAGGFPAGRS